MNFSFIIVLLCCYIIRTLCRPSHVLESYDKDIKENNYGNSYDAAFEDYSPSGRKMKQFSEKEAESEVHEEMINTNKNDANADQRRTEKEYFEDNDGNQADSTQRLPRNMLSPLNDLSKRTGAYDEDNTLFRNNARSRKTDENKYSDDAMDSSEQFRYLKPYKTIHTQGNANRDKRDVQNLVQTKEAIGIVEQSKQKNELDTNEDEETAIRRHIKKLSKEELDELLNSLSEDKRELLRNIIDNSGQYEADSNNKREITKKAGAVEENSFVGNGLSDTSKIQGGSADVDESSMSPNIEKSDNSKKGDTETVSSKPSDTIRNSQKCSDRANLSNDVEDVKLEKSDKENIETPSTDTKLQTDTGSGILSKNEKREIHLKQYGNSEDPLNNEDYRYDSEEVPNFSDEDSGLHGSKNIDKRDIFLSDSDLSNSLKSLEESFPNIDDSVGCKSESDMVPLIRVKRMKPGEIVEKRDVSLTSNIKVPFFSNAVDNSEEDTAGEGGEFQDDGFFDRTASFAKTVEHSQLPSGPSSDEGYQQTSSASQQSSEIKTNDLETETVNLGSDSDNVLSGIEGVDDNIMLNSASRTRRTAHSNEEFHNSLHKEVDSNYLSQSKNPELVSQIESLKYGNNAPHYQENDAFGSLPRNYDEDLGRFKRIRRLKPSLAPKNNDSTLN